MQFSQEYISQFYFRNTLSVFVEHIAQVSVAFDLKIIFDLNAQPIGLINCTTHHCLGFYSNRLSTDTF